MTPEQQQAAETLAAWEPDHADPWAQRAVRDDLIDDLQALAHDHDLDQVAPTARDFLAIDRPPYVPLLHAAGRKPTILLGAGSILLVAGPSGYGKTLTCIDLAGLHASDDGGAWLGLTATGGQRVLVALLEGTDEETRERISDLVPDDALDRLRIVDHWRHHIPARDDAIDRLAQLCADHQADILVIDTLAAYLGILVRDTRTGVGEEHFPDILAIRRRSGRNLAIVATTHTRKADRGGAKIDEAEEVAGTITRKVDAAIVLRPDGDTSGPRRRVTFAKVRTGPRLPDIIATLPAADSDDPPRLHVITDLGGRPIAEGTEANRIADWIRAQPAPVQTTVLLASLDLSDSTLRRRRPELEALGVTRGPIPGHGSARFYGTPQQWTATVGKKLGVPATDPPPTTRHVTGQQVSEGQDPDAAWTKATRHSPTRQNTPDGSENPASIEDHHPPQPLPPTEVADLVAGQPTVDPAAWGHALEEEERNARAPDAASAQTRAPSPSGFQSSGGPS